MAEAAGPGAAQPDPGVCERQAFGGGFSPTAKDAQLVDALKRGRLVLPPHPGWLLPDQLTWSEDPFGQRNWRAQLHMLRWLDPLRRQALAGDDEAGRLWWQYASSWIRTDHGTHKRLAWMDMVDGVRAKALVLGYPLVPSAHRDEYLGSIREHGQWLSDAANRGHSNHALHQLLGLFIVARFLRHDAWTAQTVTELAQLLVQQYDEEGVNAEGALAYHLFNYRWWRGTLQHLTVEGMALPEETRRLERARLALVHGTRPDGFLETIGDTDRVRLRETDSPEMVYMGTEGAEGTPPADVFRAFSAGYVFARSGWGEFEQDLDQESFYSLMFGKGVKVHGHDEAGSLTYYTRGGPWIVDPGKYAYVDDAFRRYITARGAHNVVLLPEEQRHAKAAVTLVRHAHSTLADDVLLQDEGYEGVRIRRRVVFHRPSECLVVIDTVFADREVMGEQRWQLAPDVHVEPVQRGYRLSRQGSPGVRLLWSGQTPERDLHHGADNPLRGWVAPGWMKTEPATQITARHRRKNFRFVTILGPEKDGDLSIRSSQTLPSGMAVDLSAGGVRHVFSITADGVVPGWVDPATLTVRPPLRASEAFENLLGPPSAVASDESDDRLVARARQAVSTDPSLDNRYRWARPLMHRLLASPDASSLTGADSVAAALVDVLGEHAPAEVTGALRQRLPLRLPALAAKGHTIPAGTYQGVRLQCDTSALDALTVQPGNEVVASTLAEDLLVPWAARGGVGDVLVVRLHGALNRQKQMLPTLVGLTSARRSPLPYLVVQDPSLDLLMTMRLSWYLGSARTDGHELVATLVDRVRAALGVRRVLLVGSSGGGYAALHLAALLRDSHALAFSPQTDLREYHRVHADQAARACFGVETIVSAPVQRIEVARRWAAAGHRPQATIILNTGDSHHVARHVEPLEATVRRSGAGDLQVRRVSLGPGHVAVRPDAADEAIAGLVAELSQTVH